MRAGHGHTIQDWHLRQARTSASADASQRLGRRSACRRKRGRTLSLKFPPCVIMKRRACGTIKGSAIVVLIALAALPAAYSKEDALGAPECPCLTELPAAVTSALADLGYPAGYGSGGCKTHDDTLAVSGCDIKDKPSYCGSPWCVSSLCLIFSAYLVSSVLIPLRRLP